MAAGMVLGRSSTMIGAGAAGFATGCTSAALVSTGRTAAVVSGVPPAPSVSARLLGCSPAGVLAAGAVSTEVTTGLEASPTRDVTATAAVLAASAALTLVTVAVVAGSGSADAMRCGPAGFGASTIFGLGTNRRAWSNSSGVTSGRVTMTRAPILVAFQSSWAKFSVRRTQP